MVNMATAIKKMESIHIRFSKENGPQIVKKIKEKMKKDTRNQNNCIEAILMEYFGLK